MRNIKRWMLVTAAFLVLLIVNVEAGAPFKKVSIATTSRTKTTSTTEGTHVENEETPKEEHEPEVEAKEVAAKEEKSEHTATTNTTATKDSKLTGIPQIDYIWDPNLPRELRGYNLSSYPFLSTTPPLDEIHFECDGLHDGFYASIEYKCQVYHHCVYGIRHDFLCANFTAFDQRTFICHFVSDVDCEGSPKYWNRNDALYMATTTTSTTTTTTEPPPTQRRRPISRPLRPLRRPSNRRPVDDYYYEEEEYDEDYYEERVNRRRKQRPRQRKPVVAEYDDEYEDEKRSLADEPPRKRLNGRDRVREDVEPEDDYDSDRRKSSSKPTAAAERRKLSSRKPSAFSGRANADERRSLSDERPTTGRRKAAAVEEPIEPAVENPRRSAGRRRINEKRSTTASPASDLDDLDEYEKPQSKIPDQEEAAADEEAPPKIKTTPKPLEEFVTPKANPSSVYARPRAPPRIARPVPVNAKNKFVYPVQKTATTSAPPAGEHGDEEYYEDEEYDDTRLHRGKNKKRIVDEVADEEEEAPAPKRGSLARNKPTRTLRKPVTEKKALPVEEEDDYEVDDRYTRRGSSRRKNPLTGRTRGRIPIREDVDFVDDDYEERPAKRSRPVGRKGAKKPILPEPVEEDETAEVEPEVETKSRGRGGSVAGRRKPVPSISSSRSRRPSAQAVSQVNSEDVEHEVEEDLDEAPAVGSSKNSLPTSRPASVRVVKRPFLPSRGGSPYLPRGLQPVGIAHKTHDTHTTDSSMIDMFSTNSGVHLLEHGAPLLRDSGPRTTLPPRSAIPVSQPRPETQPSSKATLDELYENDYDVTLNDALNPTLKPLSPHQTNLYHQNQQHHDNNNNNRPYQSIYSSSSSSSSPTSSLSPSLSDSFVYKNPSPQSSSSTSSSSDHSQAFQTQSQPPLTHSQNYNHHHETQQLQDQELPSHQHQYQPNSQNHNYNYNSDSNFSSTDIRRRTISSPPAPQTSRSSDYHRTNSNVGSRIEPNYYDDDYEY